MVERTLPKPDTRVRFPSAAPKAPDFVAGLFPRLKRESLPGGNTFPRALGISAFQPVSRSKSLLPHGRRLFILGWMWWLGSVGRVEAVCSLLLQGTRPRFASDTLMSRRNIPASPLLIPPPCGARWGRGCALWNEPRATWLGKSVRGGGEGNTRVRYRRQLAKIEYWVEGIAVTPHGRSERLPAGSRQEGFSTTMRAHGSAIPS